MNNDQSPRAGDGIPAGWALESGKGWISIRNLASQLGQDFYPDHDPLIFGFLSALAAAPAAAPAWQPIETAPRDGTRILVSWPMRELDDEGYPSGPIKYRSTLVTEMNCGHWLEPDVLNAAGEWFGDDYAYAEQPDLWMPLPAAPGIQAPATADGSDA